LPESYWETLISKLAKIGIRIESISGELKLFSCSCCGADTLTERNGWDICPVCWYEDAGQDNINSRYTYVGPDSGFHLYSQRINFIRYGIGRPERKDLFEKKEPIENYTSSRIFEIDSDKKIILEKNSDWSAPLTPPSVEEHIKQITKLPAMELALYISESYLHQDYDYPSLLSVLKRKIETEDFSPTQ